MRRRGVFLDLNGTLVEPLKRDRFDEIALIPGVVEAVARLSTAGWSASGYSRAASRRGCSHSQSSRPGSPVSQRVSKCKRALVVGPYVCPHRFADPCPARNRIPLLYDRAAAEHRLKPPGLVIGDSPEDVRAAKRLGARGCLIRTGWATDPDVLEKATPDVQCHRQLTHRSSRIGSCISNNDGEVRSESFMSASKLHADDTPVPVLEPGKGRTKTGRLWTYVHDEPRPVAGVACESRLSTSTHPVRHINEGMYSRKPHIKCCAAPLVE